MSGNRRLREIVYREDCLKMQYLASIKIVRMIWRRHVREIVSKKQKVFSLHRDRRGYDIIFTNKNQIYEKIDALLSPKLPEPAIKIHGDFTSPEPSEPAVTVVKHYMEMFLSSIKAFLLDLNAKELLLSPYNFGWLVWQWDGELDYEGTVSKMFDKSILWGAKERFIAACHYCMEEKARSVPLDQLLKSTMEPSFVHNPVQFYWIHYISRQLEAKIPRGVDEMNKSPEALVAEMCNSRNSNITAFEYFWNKVDGDNISVWKVATLRKWLGNRDDLDRRSYRIAAKLFSEIPWTEKTRPRLLQIANLLKRIRESYSCTPQWRLVDIY